MCKNPITIYNNSDTVNGNNYLACYTVPCGHCVECLQARASHYKLRCYYESLQCRDEHGICVFDTLTYRDECLPRYKGVPCFSHSDIIKFRKRLRTNIERAGYVLLDPETQEEYLRSFIVSEYGSHTKRPHYHIIVWCRAYKIVQDMRVPITPFALHSLIFKSWKYGFTDKKIKQVNINNKGLGAIHYVTKYMAKDMMEEKDLASDLLVACKQTKTQEELEQLIAEAKDRFKLRIWVSNGLGSYAIKKYFTDSHIRDFFHNTGGCFPMPNAKGMYDAVPCGHYYMYKMFYDRVFNPNTGRKDKFVISDLGLEFREQQLDIRIDRFTERLSAGVSRLTPEQTQMLLDLGCDFLNLRPIAAYAMVYRNRIFTEIDTDGFYSDNFNDYHKVYIDGINPYLSDTKNPLCPSNTTDLQQHKWHLDDHAYKWSASQNAEGLDWYEICYNILSLGVDALHKEEYEEKERKFQLYQRYRQVKCETETIV